MDTTDIREFTDIWGGVWDQYGRNQTNQGIKIAFRALVDLDLSTIRAALTAHVNEQPKEPPTVAAIRQRIAGNPMERTHHAWAKLRRAIRHVGPYRSVVFDDPLIHCAVRDMGGWVAVNDWSADEVPFRQRDFERAYQSYLRLDNVAHPAKLIGIAEAHNSQQGFENEPPALIGDAQQAQHVEATGHNDRLVTFQRRRSNGSIEAMLPTHLLANAPEGARQ